ncbi:hypothetical protein B0T13DRAFT_523105 [Neurospora crassa]|nr:hypothetical protein B0T13DRAFT_523105 [Neurospora crassa]
MPNAMSQRASEEPEDQVQGASNKAGTAVDATTSNDTSGNTDISEEEADAWYRNCPSPHAVVVRAQHIHDTRWLEVNSHLLWNVVPLTEEARLWWVAWHTRTERRMLREAKWRLWVLMNEDTPRLVRMVRGYAEGGWGGRRLLEGTGGGGHRV